jgi:hypothetical protein
MHHNDALHYVQGHMHAETKGHKRGRTEDVAGDVDGLGVAPQLQQRLARALCVCVCCMCVYMRMCVYVDDLELGGGSMERWFVMYRRGGSGQQDARGMDCERLSARVDRSTDRPTNR